MPGKRQTETGVPIMLTPQEVSEHAFAKASFGGYNMAMVDEFLDQLTEDYTAIYKENAVLKRKMKVLVDKVEEYRSTEDAMRKTLLTAQKIADEMVKEAEQKKASLVAQAEEEARKRVEHLRREVESEQIRLTAAQNATVAYIAKLKELYQHEMDYLSSLTELTAGQKGGVPAAGEAPAPDPVQEPEQEDDRPGGLYSDITATFLSEDGKTERKIKVDPERRAAEMAASAPQPDPQPKEELPPEEEEDDEPTKRLTIDLEHLQFGKDYEIK